MGNEASPFNLQSWEKLRIKLKKQVGETAYKSWLRQISFKSAESDSLTISVPTKFLRDWIATHFAEKIKVLCKEKNPEIEILKIVVKQNGGRIVPGTTRLVETQSNERKYDVRSQQMLSYPEDFGAPLDPRYAFDNFVVGKSNELTKIS